MAPSAIESTQQAPYSRSGAYNGEPYYSPKIAEKHNLRIEKQEPDSTQNKPAARISFHPSLGDFRARTSATVKAGGLQTKVEEGWPLSVNGPMTWTGSDFPNESSFVYHLSDDEKGEIDSALEYFRAQNIASIDVAREVFPLPNLEKYLERTRNDIYNGVGFVVMRGLDVDSYSTDDLSTILLGISSYIAPKRGLQNHLGSVIKHMIDVSPLESQRDLPFHTDVTCDIVATLTKECSLNGGMSTLASSSNVYNELARTRPDLLRVLAQPDWPFDTYGRNPSYYNRALLFHMEGKIMFNFSRRVLVGHPLAPRTKGIPNLTEAQAEALDAVHYCAKACHLKVSMERGDLRFINNMGLLHGREAYNDANEVLSKRHLIRAWLHNEKMAWKLPPALELAWDRTFGDDTRPKRWQAELHGPRNRSPPPRPPSPTVPCD